MLLTGYGSYGYAYDPDFDIRRLSLLDRGVMFAIAHIRGGGENGEVWREEGKMMKKKNTFLDFIACARHLKDVVHMTSTERLAICGASAGGLLVGAVLNMDPQLCRVCITRVPFVDVMGTMSDPSIPLTVTEFEEWGNPADEAHYDYLLSYSPYNNIKECDYPAIMATAGLHDSRVAYWEVAKWISMLRHKTTSDRPILLKCDLAGHGGASGRYERLREEAYLFAFMLSEFGIKR